MKPMVFIYKFFNNLSSIFEENNVECAFVNVFEYDEENIQHFMPSKPISVNKIRPGTN